MRTYTGRPHDVRQVGSYENVPRLVLLVLLVLGEIPTPQLRGVISPYLSTIEAVGTGSWLSAVQVLLDVSIALLVAIIEFHGGMQRGYRTISSESFL